MAPYLTLMTEDAPQREHPLREVFNGLRYIVRTGMQWRMMPNDLPPWHTVYQQTQRWLKAGVFEEIVHDLRMLLREIEGRNPQPRAAIFDSRTLQSSPESGARAGYDGHKRRKGSKVHLAVDTLGQLLAVLVTPANEQERAQVAELAEQVQAATGDSVEVAFVDQGYTGEAGGGSSRSNRAFALKSSSCPPPSVASSCCPGAGSSNAALPGWLASVAWHATMSAWLKRLAGLHFVAFAILMAHRFVTFMAQSA